MFRWLRYLCHIVGHIPARIATKKSGWAVYRCERCLRYKGMDGYQKGSATHSSAAPDIEKTTSIFGALVSEYLKHHTTRELAHIVETAPFIVQLWADGYGAPMKGVRQWITDCINKIRQEEGW